ncbi:MAG TPA: cyanophycin synthetase, partial [Candidatus Binataceae bacterium]
DVCASSDAQTLEAEIAMLGDTAAVNCAAAVAAVLAVMPRPVRREHLDAIASALASARPLAGRLSTLEARGVLVIDDTYNANPRSMRTALSAAREFADLSRSRLVIALGDMLELGALAPQAHRDSLAEAIKANPDNLVVVGPEMAAALKEVPHDPGWIGVSNSEAAARVVSGLVRKGDVLLVKGSRGMRMERVIEMLTRSKH